MRKRISADTGFTRAPAAMTDSQAGAESLSRGYYCAKTTVPSSRRSPSPAGLTALGALLPPPAAAPGALRRQRPALRAARVGGTQETAAEIALLTRSCLCSFTEGTKGLRVVTPWPAQGDRKRNGPGLQAPGRSREEEGQTQSVGQGVQWPPRPLREGSRGGERPGCLLQGALTSPHPCRGLWGLDTTPSRRMKGCPGRESRERATSAPG